jgi:hypothetical protein
MRIALAETLIRRTFPSTIARTFCMLGLNFLLVLPVTLRPTPPKYLALPRRAILLPELVFLPVKKQTLDISYAPANNQSERVNIAAKSNISSTNLQNRFFGP